jgi:hypothetical protein
VFKFSSEPKTVPASAYYLDRLRDGDLLPADDDTRKLAKCRFKSSEEALKAAREKVDADHGKGAFDAFMKELDAGSSDLAVVKTEESKSKKAKAGSFDSPQSEGGIQ